MEKNELWRQYAGWRSTCRWVELTRELSPSTLHWSGFPDLEVKQAFDYPDGFLVHQFTLVSQYGTHVDAPAHFVPGARTLEQIRPQELVLPLCVVDVSAQVRENADFVAGAEYIRAWESIHGQIPQGAFVALRTDWSKRDELDNTDEKGVKHFPGWGLDALELLVQERNAAAIGHEPADTDAGASSAEIGYVGERYILEQDRYQIELMCNLDQVPPTGGLIFCGFPKVKGSPGFTARCIALCPRD